MIFPPAWRFTVEDVAPPEAVTPATLPAELRGLGSRPAGLPQLGRKNDLHAASHVGEPTRTPPRVGDPASQAGNHASRYVIGLVLAEAHIPADLLALGSDFREEHGRS
jgi:hypothetical protein